MEDWSQIHEKYGSMVWATVYRILSNEAESLDCCQDVFAELLQQSHPEQVENWPAFLCWLATRRALDQLRKRRHETAKFSVGKESATANCASNPVSEASWNELIVRLKQELLRLPNRQAEVFWLFSIEGMTYGEIASQIGADTNEVGVLLHRARQQLRELLGEFNPLKLTIDPD